VKKLVRGVFIYYSQYLLFVNKLSCIEQNLKLRKKIKRLRSLEKLKTIIL
jgi:hypothetical protein